MVSGKKVHTTRKARDIRASKRAARRQRGAVARQAARGAARVMYSAKRAAKFRRMKRMLA
jgi:hypothetical protein